MLLLLLLIPPLAPLFFV
ncbi:hypothetical protein Golob_027736 [Gossypium lobatum]|uniref:Uncharacterized protein n=1 Tax=Gossypium lobatum TaxID=34289 RepID=A0A7J8NF76_9ROSI|nr:hypothetical protein [Gossypium lobatum]